MSQHDAFFRGIGRAPDATALAFYSDANTAAIQSQLRYEVHRCTGIVIGNQSPEALRSAMEAVYEDHATTRSNCGPFAHGQLPGMFSGPGVQPGVFPQQNCGGPQASSVAQLNNNVLRRIVSGVISGVRSHRHYLDDIAQPNPLPLERPEFMGTAGRKQLNLFRH
jgi:hypothetical protein